MIKSVSQLLQEGATLDKDILEIMDESVPSFEYTSTGLDANYLEGENFISEAYADMMAYKAEANQILIESMGSMNESAVAEMRRMIDETVKSKAVSIGFKIAQFFRALAKKVRVAILGGQLKTISKMIPKLESSGADLTLAHAKCEMADSIIYHTTECITDNANKPADELFEALATGFDDVIEKINKLKLDDHIGRERYNLGQALANHVDYAKDLITALEKWATAAVNTSSAEDAAKARKVSSNLNKILTAYLKAISATLKTIKDAAAKSNGKKSKDDKPAPEEK